MGGGVVAEIFPVNKSLTFPRFRDIFGAFSGHLPIIRRLWTLAENSGTLPMSAYTFKPRNNINSFRKKTFTKSLGGAMAPLAPPLATPLTSHCPAEVCMLKCAYYLLRIITAVIAIKGLVVHCMYIEIGSIIVPEVFNVETACV